MSGASETGGAPAAVSIRSLGKSFGKTAALASFDLDVGAGSFASILGPSGCGKTTLLRIIAGFIEPDAGAIEIDGRDIGSLGPERRGVGMVFQDYALFPHLDVAGNLAYGLKASRVAKAERPERIARAIAALELAGLERRYPHELSGGQQQRVALGRALVLRPRLLLMDEPLSNLDARLRESVRDELKALRARLGITTIYVTHDQEEAFSLSDAVTVMNAGTVAQTASPEELYRRPASAFVAEFAGRANFLPAVCRGRSGRLADAETALGRVAARAAEGDSPRPGEAGTLMIRPEWIVLARPGDAPAAFGHRLRASATILSVDFIGSRVRYRLKVDDIGEEWTAEEAVEPAGEPRRPGSRTIAITPAGSAWWIGA
jgi:putative spermidine/putrescine transport system ATP-binding protein